MSLAPILVSVYTRLNHLTQCIDSLKKNLPSAMSVLYIVSDGASSPADEASVASVREYIARVKGFAEVIPILRTRNRGSHNSINDAITQVAAVHGKVIFLEDDNEVSPNFLSFMNEGLDFYRDDPSVFSISSYNYPVTMPQSYPYDVYKWMGYSGWGVGLWYERWAKIDWAYPSMAELSWGKPKRRALDQIAEHLCRQMIYDITHWKMTGDTIISYHIFTQGLYSIFPVVSKVKNAGHDGTGEHGGVTDRYLKQPIDSGAPFQFVSNLQPDEEINRILRWHFATPLTAKIVMALSRFIPNRQKQWIKVRLYSRKK